MKRVLAAFLVGCSSLCFAGGPIAVGGPNLGVDGQPMTWAAMPIHYRVDGGPFALRAGNIIVDHATGVNRVNAMFAVWQGVSTATLSYQNDGAILSTGSFADGDVNTLSEYNDVKASCANGTQNPVVFDADGTLLKALNADSNIIGFASPCAIPVNNHFVGTLILLNGAFQDGNNTNGELTSQEFDEAIIHEIGHMNGLDHSQINVSVLGQATCSSDLLAGLPLMFPFSSCQARAAAGLPVLSEDDKAWISSLYPSGTFATTYGFIEGHVYFSDGITQAQDVNVIARRVDDPNTPEDESLRIAFSVVSGFLFTDWPGQSVTPEPGDPFGSRDPQKEGYFRIPVLPGQYRVRIETINPQFDSGSSVGPISTPIPAPGDSVTQTVTVTVGVTSTLNITLFGTNYPRFDPFEDESRLIPPDIGLPRQKRKVIA